MMPSDCSGRNLRGTGDGVKDYVKVLKRCLVPMGVMLVYGMIFIYFSKPLAALF